MISDINIGLEIIDMNNKFIYSNDKSNKRYHTYDYYLNAKYNMKVAKVSINAGFSCPHLLNDGKGCIFCDEKYHNIKSNIKSPEEIIAEFEKNRAIIFNKWGDTGYIAYFQTGTNTFAPLDVLKKTYESVLNVNRLVGIDIATRPDCITPEIAEYLAYLNTLTDVTVELGLQTMHDETAQTIKRGYALDCFENAYKILSAYKIPVTVHIINSLPYETPHMMIETAKYLASLNPLPFGVKIHMLSVIRGTELHKIYVNGGIKIMSEDEYTDVVIDMLEVLPPEIVIMRITGDPENEKLIAPKWTLNKFNVMNAIDKKMRRRGTYQGKRSGEVYLREISKNTTDIIDVADFTGITNDITEEKKKMSERHKNSLTNILSMAKRLLDISIKENGVYADFTMGKGNDTLYIKKACPSAKIYAFDIQPDAVDITRRKLEEENCLDNNVRLILDSHANFEKYLDEDDNARLDGAIFNLGYLPGGDKNITTLSESTLVCLKAALERLNVRGIIVVVIYPGHDEGEHEGKEIFRLAEKLDSQRFDCLHHRLINIKDAPYIIAFQKKI